MNGEFPPQPDKKTGSRAKALFEALKDPAVKDQAVETFINIGFPAVDAALSGAGRELGLTEEHKGRSRFNINPFIERVSKMADKPLPAVASRLAYDAIHGARDGLREHAHALMDSPAEQVRFVDSVRSLGGAITDAYGQARQMQAAEAHMPPQPTPPEAAGQVVDMQARMQQAAEAAPYASQRAA